MIPRRTIATHLRELNRVLDLLRPAVSDGAIPPGELDETRLAERYGAAPALVAEACAQLVREGLLEPASPGRWVPASS